MRTPEKISPQQYSDQVEAFIAEQCVKDPETLKISCRHCGAAIAARTAWLSIHLDMFRAPEGDFPCGGHGEVRRVAIPYCPRCEPVPEESGCLHEQVSPVVAMGSAAV